MSQNRWQEHIEAYQLVRKEFCRQMSCRKRIGKWETHQMDAAAGATETREESESKKLTTENNGANHPRTPNQHTKATSHPAIPQACEGGPDHPPRKPPFRARARTRRYPRYAS